MVYCTGIFKDVQVVHTSPNSLERPHTMERDVSTVISTLSLFNEHYYLWKLLPIKSNFLLKCKDNQLLTLQYNILLRMFYRSYMTLMTQR